MPKTFKGNTTIEYAYELLVKKYKSLHFAEWEKIWAITSYKRIKKGETFIESDRVSRSSAFVVSGYFKQTMYDEDMAERNLNFYFKGDLLSNCDSYRNQRPSISSVTALTDAELLVFTNDVLYEMKESDLAMANLGLSLSHALLEQETDHLKLLSLKNPFERYRLLVESKPHIVANISLTEIARYLYVSRETVSRARLKLTDDARNYCD